MLFDRHGPRALGDWMQMVKQFVILFLNDFKGSSEVSAILLRISWKALKSPMEGADGVIVSSGDEDQKAKGMDWSLYSSQDLPPQCKSLVQTSG